MKSRGRAPATELTKTNTSDSATPIEAAAGVIQAATQDVELVLEEMKNAAHTAMRKIRAAVPTAAPSKQRRARTRKSATKKSGGRAKSGSKKAAPRRSARAKRRR